MWIKHQIMPVYVVVDTSASMAGEPIQQAESLLRAMSEKLLDDPCAVDAAHLGVVSFDDEARVLCPLTAIAAFTPPAFNVTGGRSSLGLPSDVWLTAQ
jgi:uncharacterized protein YegL